MADLAALLRKTLPPGAEVADDEVTRRAWAHDASIYLLIPRVVVWARHEADVLATMVIARDHGVPVCVRAGGTSLSGQAVTDGILLVVSRHLREITVLEDGAAVRCGPGAVGAWVNAALAPHGRRIGPDPASIQAAEIGGIVANNASGMCCGVAENSYRTVTGLRLALADGYVLDTGAADADERLRRDRPDLAAGLTAIARDLAFTPGLADRVRQAFATKNTVGYSLNAFLDAEGPAGIIQRLVVGSEGTLAVILAATFRTLPLPRCRATAFVFFPSIEEACAVVPSLGAAAAVELLDAVSLRRVAGKLPDPMPAGEPAALLIECQAADEAGLADAVAAITAVLPATFSRNPARQGQLWAVRKGLFPSVGAVRRAGTTVVIEDITYPVARLAEGVRRLRGLFTTHGYDDAVVFGHAKDGNLHFTLTPDLAQEDERRRYDGFLQAMAEDVLALGGHLKAEHGTGRNMAPWVTAQWGPEAVALMRRVKDLLDPRGLLNPGVLLSDDPQAHLRHLKPMPPVDSAIDACIECGFCEPVCPSRDAALSPRQRIVLWREGLGEAAVPTIEDACAADGSCATACPVGIDTGAAVKVHRARRHGPLAHEVAGAVRRHLPLVLGVARAGLLVLQGWRLPGRAIPLPPPAPALPRAWPVGTPTIAYLPTCLTRTMGPDAVAHDLARLCRAAGIGLVVPEGVAGLCCGQPFDSKGFPAEGDAARAALLAAVRATGATAVILDTAPCAAAVETEDVTIYDPARFAVEVLLPRLPTLTGAALLIHPTCSEERHGGRAHLAALPGAVIPATTGCCGMAGDRGWLVPGLTAAATAREATAVADLPGDGTVASTTCGLALSAASGRDYRHLFSRLAARLPLER